MIKKTLIGILFLLPITNLAAQSLESYKAHYKVYRKGSELGDGFRQLEQLDQDKYRLESGSNISWLFLSDSRKEFSEFTFDEGNITPLNYNYERTGTGRDGRQNLTFSGQDVEGLYKGKKFTAQFEGQAFDPLLYQLQMRLELKAGKTEFDYPLYRKGELTHYKFKVIEKETLTLPYGKVEALKILRVRESSRRKTLMWVAPELDYLLVKMTQYKNGKEQADLRLEWVKFGNQNKAAADTPSPTAKQ